MESEITEQACQFIKDSTVNIGLEFSADQNGEMLYQLRATPWRGSSRGEVMILVAEGNIGEALVTLATEISDNRWVPLNWRVRLSQRGAYVPSALWRSMQNGREALLSFQKPSEEPIPIERPRKDANKP